MATYLTRATNVFKKENEILRIDHHSILSIYSIVRSKDWVELIFLTLHSKNRNIFLNSTNKIHDLYPSFLLKISYEFLPLHLNID